MFQGVIIYKFVLIFIRITINVHVVIQLCRSKLTFSRLLHWHQPLKPIVNFVFYIYTTTPLTTFSAHITLLLPYFHSLPLPCIARPAQGNRSKKLQALFALATTCNVHPGWRRTHTDDSVLLWTQSGSSSSLCVGICVREMGYRFLCKW